MVLFLHGFLEDHTIWEEIGAALRSHCQVVGLDLPGHGQSPALNQSHSMEQYALVVEQLLMTLGGHPALIVCHSMGGYVALALAEKAPHLVLGLLLVNTTPDQDHKDRKDNRNRALRIVKTQANAFVSMAIENLCTPQCRERFSSEINALKKRALAQNVSSLTKTIIGLRDRRDRNDILRAFEGPKQLIMGRQDPLIPLSQAKQIARQTDTKITIVDGGHMSWLEHPQEIVEQIKTLLAR